MGPGVERAKVPRRALHHHVGREVSDGSVSVPKFARDPAGLFDEARHARRGTELARLRPSSRPAGSEPCSWRAQSVQAWLAQNCERVEPPQPGPVSCGPSFTPAAGPGPGEPRGEEGSGSFMRISSGWGGCSLAASCRQCAACLGPRRVSRVGKNRRKIHNGGVAPGSLDGRPAGGPRGSAAGRHAGE